MLVRFMPSHQGRFILNSHYQVIHSHIISISSPSKQKDSLALGADKVLTAADFESTGKCVDVMICTVCHHDADWRAYLGLMRPFGKFCVVGGKSRV